MVVKLANWGLLLAALAIGCGSSGDGGPAPAGPKGPRNHAVTIDDGFFFPEDLTIDSGDSVTWTWRQNDDHSVTEGTSPDPGEEPRLFDSGIRRSGNFGYRFKQTGSVSYFCREHWDMGMSGRVLVEP